MNQVPTPLVPSETNDPLIAALERAMYDPSFDTAKFDVLINHVIRLQEREAAREFNEAMSRVQAQLDTIEKDRANPHTRSRYATLDALYTASMPVCSAEGITVRFGSEPPPRESWLRVTCTLSKGRYAETHYLEGPIGGTTGTRGGATQMTPIQAVGSTVTYLRRYLLMMVLNLVQANDEADNDGNPVQSERRDPLRNITWIRTKFRERCEAIQDKDQATALLNDEALKDAEERLKDSDHATWVEFDAIRQEMIDRIWPKEVAEPATEVKQ